MLLRLFSATAALALVAFAPAVDADPAPQGVGWHLSYEEATAKLAYGLANSDQIALMLTCEPGAGRVSSYGDVEPVARSLTKASDDLALDPMSGGLADEARLSASDAALSSLARRGKLAVSDPDAGRLELSANTAERGLVRDFVAYCRSGRA